ncbi:hypothetical protein GQX74_014470 [Glossina fuscipes]|nr:hypothetical protein GQX74_014470 [Glossina fuscipes]
MGNSLTNRTKTPNGSTYAPSILNKNTWKRERNRQEYELRSKTLPVRSSAPAVNLEPTAIKSLPKTTKTAATSATATSAQNAGETSRVLFLLYLIHRTWNVLTDNKSKSSHHSQSMAKTVNDSAYFESSDCSLAVTDLQSGGGGGGGDSISQCCSQYSLCSCSSCYNELQQQNIYSSIDEEYSQDSIGEKAKHFNKRCTLYNTANSYRDLSEIAL